MDEWTYYSFYFGSAGYPSDSLWRVHRGTGEKQLQIAGGGHLSVEEVRAQYEKLPESGGARLEPEYQTWGDDKIYYGLVFWLSFETPEKAEEAWTRDCTDGWGGGPQEIDWYKPGTPLYEEKSDE